MRSSPKVSFCCIALLYCTSTVNISLHLWNRAQQLCSTGKDSIHFLHREIDTFNNCTNLSNDHIMNVEILNGWLVHNVQ